MKRSNDNLPMEAVRWMAKGHIEAQGKAMQTRTDACLSGDAGLPSWRPQPGEVLAGVIDRYTVSETAQGLVRTVIITQERTGQQVSVQLASTSLLALFAEQQPHPGARIDVRYRGHTPDYGYQRWTLVVNRPVPLELSPLGGEASDEAPWHRERRVAEVITASPPGMPRVIQSSRRHGHAWQVFAHVSDDECPTEAT